MKILSIALTLFVIGYSAQSVVAQPDPDIANLYSAVSAMETAPFEKDTKKMRETAFLWVVETDKVSVVACSGAMAPFMEKKNKYGSELLMSYTLAMAAFKLRNPDNKSENDAQVAGVESALKSYETMLMTKKKAKFAAMDDLIAKRDSGDLEAHVEAAGCS